MYGLLNRVNRVVTHLGTASDEQGQVPVKKLCGINLELSLKKGR